MPWQLTWKIYSKLLKARMWRSAWAIKARWIEACLVSSKRYGITITKLLVLFHVSYKVVVVKQCLLHNIAENINKKVQKQGRKIIKIEKRCRNGVPKSTWTRKDKVIVNIQSPFPTSLLFWKDVGMDEALYIYYHFYPSLSMYFLARHSYISFHF